MWQLWHRKTHFLCNHRNRMWSHVLNHTSQIGSGFVWKFFCWMLTRIKYCKLPPLLCKDSRQKEVKPQLCWDKIESHSSHLSLWSRISGWCRLLGDPGPGDLGGSLGAAGRARNFRTLITTETVPVMAEQISSDPKPLAMRLRSHKNYSLLATFWWEERVIPRIRHGDR